jgi:hypothetical protein
MLLEFKARSVLPLMIAACLGVGAAQPAWADGDRVEQLEARVAELEALLRQLVDQRAKDRAETTEMVQQASAQAQQAQAQVATVVEKVQPVIEEAEHDDKHQFKFGGYVKVDTLFSNYSDGDIASNSIGRDFYVPSTVPVGGEDESTDVDFHARQTRFYFGTDHELDNGDKLSSYVEFDFLVTPGGNERVSNSYLPRMRHAYLKYNNWLVGQTWSTFMDVATLPETLDFVGPAESTSFNRQPMIRYTQGNFAVALENPETTVTPFEGGARITADDSLLPDLTARYTHKGDFGHIQLAGILRQLEYEDEASNVDDREVGWGVSLSGKFNVGRDDIRWMAIHGEGLGRYVGLNVSNGAVITDNNELDAIKTTGGFFSYRHWWNDQWRSTAVFSYMDIDNKRRFTGDSVTDNVWSGHINLLYSPTPPLTFGVEYLYADRELESGQDGSLSRLQFSGKYAFSL